MAALGSFLVIQLFCSLPGNVNTGLVVCSAELLVASLLRRSPTALKKGAAKGGSLLASAVVLEIPVKLKPLLDLPTLIRNTNYSNESTNKANGQHGT